MGVCHLTRIRYFRRPRHLLTAVKDAGARGQRTDKLAISVKNIQLIMFHGLTCALQEKVIASRLRLGRKIKSVAHVGKGQTLVSYGK
jgi:hypothetical protein